MVALFEIWLALSAGIGWAGTVVAVALDARARIDNRSAARAAGLLAAALPFAGAALWLCLRPAETRRDRRERRLTDAVCELDAPAAAPVAAPRPAPADLRAAA
jgi:uncharacterized membrane protein